MKKIVLSSLFVAAVLGVHAQSSVTLHVNDVADGTAITAEIGCTFQDEKPIAEAVLKNGQAVFNLPVTEPRMIDFRVKGNDGRLLHLMTTKGENVAAYVTAKRIVSQGVEYINGNEEKQQVFDSPTHAEYMIKIGAFKSYLNLYNKSYHDAFKSVNDQINKAYEAKDTATVKALQQSAEYQQMIKFDSEFFKLLNEEYPKRFAANRETFWSPLMQLDTYTYFTPENRAGYDELSDAAKNSFYGKCLKEQVYPKGFTGQAYSEFDVLDQNGKKTPSRKLIKGKKYMLIDFWASWCRPCRAEIPNLKQVYADYAAKGLQIISVSLDRSDAAWKKALKEEQLPWPNGIDKSGIANAYKVQTIPAMFLVDVATGKIVGENLRGESLRNKLAELLK